MRLLDSNIIIYASKPGFQFLHSIVAAPGVYTSAVSFVEVLGYHQLTPAETQLFEEFFANTPVFPLSPVVLDKAIQLRRQRKMKLGDSLVAATALVFQCELVTRNVSDFGWITGLALFDPFKSTTS